MIFFRRASSKETSHNYFFAVPASPETSHNYFFAAQAPALEVPLRIPSGDEVIPVESGQRETSHNLFLGSREKLIMTRLDRGGARLPGDES